MDRYKCLEAFVQVAEMGSVSRAAAALSVSKSVVSERLSQLEALVGQTMLLRTSRRVRLSEAGAAAYPVYADLVARMRELETSLAALPARLSGRLRVASTIDIGVSELAEMVSAFARIHTGLSVELVVGDRMVNPVEDGFDVTLHYRRLASDRIEQAWLADVPTAVYAAPEYLASHGTPRAPEDLAHHRCIGYSQQLTVNDWNSSEWVFDGETGEHRVRVQLAARSNSGLVLRRLAIDGHGIAVLPRFRAASAVADGALLEVLPDHRPPRLSLYASYAATQHETLKIARFIEALREGFGRVFEAAAAADRD
jgi:DNA-binding transcriptional LysR family regulator